MDWLYKLSYCFQLFLVLIIYLDHDNADGLVFTICCHLGDVPVAWKEDEEFARIAVEETGLMIVSLVHMLKMNLREKIKNDWLRFYYIIARQSG